MQFNADAILTCTLAYNNLILSSSCQHKETIYPRWRNYIIYFLCKTSTFYAIYMKHVKIEINVFIRKKIFIYVENNF